ncbi:MAG: hypothetical protein CTY34_06925 [Methylobacter sp.]|nr:MAG: hypothetical protein CTY34_06925 [Methylobacter sp.]PPD03496.1 MAG: hypothetical protein CTY29_09365 [Methylobacter sp.]PPD21269.1 MAG: hypothetical protein CTY24_08090 [Methylobacter sp.]
MFKTLISLFTVVFLSNCAQQGVNRIAPMGSQQWFLTVEQRVNTGDKQGHGPDVGSEEWKYVISRKLGIYDAEGHGPDLGSEEWLRAVHRHVFKANPD